MHAREREREKGEEKGGGEEGGRVRQMYRQILAVGDGQLALPLSHTSIIGWVQ